MKQMKTIMYVWRSMALLAGIERTLYLKINWLASHGYHVVLVTYEQGEHPVILPLHPDVKIIDLNTPFYTLSRFPLYRRWFKYLQMKSTFYRRLNDVVEDIHPDVVLTIAGCMNVIKEIYKACCKSKMIIESHETFFSVIKEPVFVTNPIIRWIAKKYDKSNLDYISRFDRLISLTHGDAEEWRKHVSNQIEVIPNPLKEIPISMKDKFSDSFYRIISAGRFEDVKGFDSLIKAFSLIADICPKWRIDIFGSGCRERHLRDLITYHRLENRIAILPPTHDIYSEYLSSDFYVLSSQHEGFGMVLIEAMSCGKPCVAFNCDYGPREIIDNGITGLLVEDGNIEQLAEKMQWMIEHGEERIKMGERAREAIKKYSLETIMLKWVHIFDELD